MDDVMLEQCAAVVVSRVKHRGSFEFLELSDAFDCI